jgi:uncharacterized protein (DUF2141 family)
MRRTRVNRAIRVARPANFWSLAGLGTVAGSRRPGRRCLALTGSLLLLVAGVSGAPAEETATGSLEIVFSGLENDRGTAAIGLMNSADHFENDTAAFRSATPAIKNGEATASFHDLPYGRYAVKIYHDENANGKLDTNFVGYPKESFGFSNNAMGRFGPPTFEAASFEIAGPTVRIVITAK